MSHPTQNLDRIAALRAEIAELEIQAVHELVAKRENLKRQLDELDSEIQRITGKAPRGSKVRSKSGRTVSYEELKRLLEQAPGHTINVRKEKIDFAPIKGYAASHPGTLKLGGKGPWPTVTLVK